MNKTHCIVWSAIRQAYVVTHEHATNHGKPASTRAAAVLVAGLLTAAPALASTCLNLAGTTTKLPDSQCSRLEVGESLKVSNNNAIHTHGSGLLVNAGTIEGAGTSGEWQGAILVHGGPLDGLRNEATGSITGTGSNIGVFVNKYGSSLGSVAGIANSGIIQSEGNHGIRLEQGSTLNVFPGSQDGVAFLNAAGATVVGGTAAFKDVPGDYLLDSSALSINAATVNGHIVNQGTMIGVGAGLSIGSHFGPSTLNGDIVNQGTIRGRRSGIDLYNDALITGSIRNSQLIEATEGDAIYLGFGSSVKEIVNSGILLGKELVDETGDGAPGRGLYLMGTVLVGGIDNTGRIEGEQIGIELFNATVGEIRNSGKLKGDWFAVKLAGETSVGGLTLQGRAGQQAELEAKGYAVLVSPAGQPEPVLRLSSGAPLGGIKLAGYTTIKGDVFAAADDVMVEGDNNRINSALEVQSLKIAADGELVLESLASSSKAWLSEHSDAGPTLDNALKTSGGRSGGVFNNGRLVLAKADSYQIIGDYSQAAGATLVVRATSDTAYSQLKVLETAKLASGTKIAVDVRQDGEIAAGATSSNTLFKTNRLVGVIQAGTLESDGKLTVNDNSALFDFGVEQTGNNVDLVLKRAEALEPEPKPVYLEQIVKDNKGLVPLASVEAARVLDNLVNRLVTNQSAGQMAPVISALGKLGSQTELAQAVEQLTPALPSVALSAVSDSLGAINRVVQARIEGNTGLSSGDEMSAERYVWVKPFGSYARQETRRETAGFKANTGGLVFGADAALGPKLRLGAAFAYAHSDVDGRSTSAPQSSKVDIYQLVGYGSVQLDGNTELNFQLDTGRNRNRGERQLPFMGMTARSDYDSLSYHVGAGVGRTFTFPREINTTPSLRLDYTRIKEDSYRETGAGAASLTNGKRAVEQTLLAVDNRVTLPLSARQSVAINAGAAYDLMDDDATLTSAFAGEPGAVFSTTAAGQSRWLWRAGLGYTYKADTGKGGLELTTRLDGEWRKGGYSNATASVKARYAF